MSIFLPKARRDRRKKAAYWHYSFMVRGQRYKGSTRCTDRESAERFEAKLRARVERGESAHAEESLARLIEEFCAELQRRQRTSRYVMDTCTILTSMCEAGGWTVIGDVTPKAIGEALGRVTHTSRLSPTTSNKYRAMLRSFFSYLVRVGVVESNPVVRVLPATVSPRQYRAFTSAELAALFAAEPKRNDGGGRDSWPRRRALYIAAAATGMRHGELQRARVEDFDLEARLVRGSQQKSRKGGFAQPILEEAIGDLRRLLVTLAPADRPFDFLVIQRTFQRDLARAGIPRDAPGGRVSFHSFRRSYATRLAAAGVPLAHISHLMRHSSIEVTMRYVDPFASLTNDFASKVRPVGGDNCSASTLQAPKDVTE